MNRARILLYGHFGSGNVGNDSTFEAALHSLQALLPSASFTCVCDGPQWIHKRFGVEAVPIDDSGTAAAWHAVRSKWAKLKWILTWPWVEGRAWLGRVRWLRSADLFVVVGTGAVDDMGVRAPLDAPFSLYKWCRCAKSAGVRVAFLSVGVGPIVHPLSRALMLRALRLADFRSYREIAAIRYLQENDFDTRGDAIGPDLVFGLAPRQLPACGDAAGHMTVGLGLICYYGWQCGHEAGEAVFQRYMSHMKRFANHLVTQGYRIRILVGDNSDTRPSQEIMNHLDATFPMGRGELFIAEPIDTVDDLLAQVAQVQVVVASRFHNVLCSLIAGRPTVSVGYHEKSRLLMAGVGLDNYCQEIDTLDFDRLVEQFALCWENRRLLEQLIQRQTAGYRAQLDEQYRSLLAGIDRVS